MKKLHKAVHEYKFFKRHNIPNTFLVYNNLKNEYIVYISWSKQFIETNMPFYNVY